MTNNLEQTWLWEIDSRHYGETKNIYYSDFTIIDVYITNGLTVENSNVSVTSTSGMISGQKIIIVDETLQEETNYISSVINGTNFVLQNPASLSYDKKNNPSVKVLSNTFGNYHTHQIKNCQIEELNIQEYVPLGYPSTHSHKSLPLIPIVSKVAERSKEIVAIGSSGKIFSSYNVYGEWGIKKDLSKIMVHGNPVTSITDITIDADNNNFVVGTDNGYIVTEGYSNSIVPLIKPIV